MEERNINAEQGPHRPKKFRYDEGGSLARSGERPGMATRRQGPERKTVLVARDVSRARGSRYYQTGGRGEGTCAAERVPSNRAGTRQERNTRKKEGGPKDLFFVQGRMKENISRFKTRGFKPCPKLMGAENSS